MTAATKEPADEVRSLARLAFQELSGAAGGIWGFHRAMALLNHPVVYDKLRGWLADPA